MGRANSSSTPENEVSRTAREHQAGARHGGGSPPPTAVVTALGECEGGARRFFEDRLCGLPFVVATTLRSLPGAASAISRFAPHDHRVRFVAREHTRAARAAIAERRDLAAQHLAGDGHLV